MWTVHLSVFLNQILVSGVVHAPLPSLPRRQKALGIRDPKDCTDTVGLFWGGTTAERTLHERVFLNYSGQVRPRQGTEICNFGAPSPLKALHWIFCLFSSIYVQFSKTSPLKSGESSEKSSGENRVKSCHVCGCHGFLGPELRTFLQKMPLKMLRNVWAFYLVSPKNSCQISAKIPCGKSKKITDELLQERREEIILDLSPIRPSLHLHFAIFRNTSGIEAVPGVSSLPLGGRGHFFWSAEGKWHWSGGGSRYSHLVVYVASLTLQPLLFWKTAWQGLFSSQNP